MIIQSNVKKRFFSYFLCREVCWIKNQFINLTGNFLKVDICFLKSLYWVFLLNDGQLWKSYFLMYWCSPFSGYLAGGNSVLKRLKIGAFQQPDKCSATSLIHILDAIAFDPDCRAGKRGILTSFFWCWLWRNHLNRVECGGVRIVWNSLLHLNRSGDCFEWRKFEYCALAMSLF